MNVREPSGVPRRCFIKQSSMVAGGATLVGAMGLSSNANAILGDDHPSNAGLAHLDPSIERWRKEYCRRAREIFRELVTVLADERDEPFQSAILSPKGTGMDDPGSAYTHLLGTCRQLLEKALANGGDSSVLFRLSIYLRTWKSVAPSHDSRVAAVAKAWENVQRVYFLDESSFTRTRPTILFIHGSGIGPFPVFNGLFKEFSPNYNTAFFLYDHLGTPGPRLL